MAPGRECTRFAGVPDGMKLMRSAVVLGVAKRLLDEARKPQNQARIKSAMERVRAARSRSRS